MQEFTVNAVGKDDKLEMALKGAYSAKNYSVITTLAQSGKVRAHTRLHLAAWLAGWLGPPRAGCLPGWLVDGHGEYSLGSGTRGGDPNSRSGLDSRLDWSHSISLLSG